VGERTCISPRGLSGGTRGPERCWRGGGMPGRRRWALVIARQTRSVPGAGARGGRRPADPFH
jgi:hypothetical protein